MNGAIVTGAAQGLGATIAERLAADGAGVLCVDLDSEGAAATAQRIIDAGGSAAGHQADCSDEAGVQGAIEAAKQFGQLKTLVANAGVVHFAPVTDCTVEDWDKVQRVNLRGTFLAIKHGAPAMIEAGGGSIITMSSLAGHMGFPGLTAYCSSKAGIILLSKTAAVELRPAGVRVNAVLPAFVDTPMQQHAISVFEQALGEGGALTMIERMQGRMAYPDDISGVVAFLASDDARMMTGTATIVDGGTSAALS